MFACSRDWSQIDIMCICVRLCILLASKSLPTKYTMSTQLGTQYIKVPWQCPNKRYVRKHTHTSKPLAEYIIYVHVLYFQRRQMTSCTPEKQALVFINFSSIQNDCDDEADMPLCTNVKTRPLKLIIVSLRCSGC